MKWILLLTIILLLGCGLFSGPNDFPPPPEMTPIVEWPQVTATATMEPRLRPVLSKDMQDAETFILILKTSMAAGDDQRIAESVKYPLRVRIDGQEMLLLNESEFLSVYEKIFDQEFVDRIFEFDESDLLLLADGFQAANGALWFNYFCVDPECSESQFLITQINK